MGCRASKVRPPQLPDAAAPPLPSLRTLTPSELQRIFGGSCPYTHVANAHDDGDGVSTADSSPLSPPLPSRATASPQAAAAAASASDEDAELIDTTSLELPPAASPC
jgi:hypothetical protein